MEKKFRIKKIYLLYSSLQYFEEYLFSSQQSQEENTEEQIQESEQ